MEMIPLSEHFSIEYGSSLALNSLKRTNVGQGVAFVSRTAKNNGVAAWVEPLLGLPPIEAGRLTVSLRSRNHALATFVQSRPFYSAYHVYVLRPLREMSTEEKIWWARCIEHNRYRYNFGRQANRTLPSLMVPKSAPDWVFETRLPTFGTAGLHADMQLEEARWSPFTLGDMFEVRRGENIIKRNMVSGGIPYVSAMAHNNGVAARLAQPPNFPAGCITVVSNGNGGMGYAFYQAEPFLASGDVSVLIPKVPMPPEACLFLCTIIKRERYRWHFNRKWTTSKIRESTIQLPVTGAGEPDWEWMSRFIQSLPLSRIALEAVTVGN